MDNIFIETLKCVTDKRGKLYPIDFADLPFKPKRLFLVYDVPKGEIRGDHAHYTTKQILYCIKGVIRVTLECPSGDALSYDLHQGDSIFVNKMIWDSQTFLTGNDVLMVIASSDYNKDDYITDKSLFKNV